MRRSYSILSVYNLMIGERTAEDISSRSGLPSRREKELYEVRGRDLVTGLPKTVEITSEVVLLALAETVASIVEAIRFVWKTPPGWLLISWIEDILAGGVLRVGQVGK